MKTIGIDIGTTGICGVRMDIESGTVEDSITVNENVWLESKDNFAKLQDPEKIKHIATDILNKLMVNDIEAIGVTGQMHGIVYLNGHGKAVSPLYTWQDQRGNENYKDGKTYAEFLCSHAGYGNVTHFYNFQNGLVPNDAVCYCTIHDYVALTLCNKKTPLMHISDAASFGNFNLTENRFTIDSQYLPGFTDKCEILGYYGNIPVSVAIGDNQAGFIGSGCDENTVLFNVGTGSQISFLSENISTRISGIEIRPLTDGKYIAVGSSLCGGRAYALLEKFFNDFLKLAGVDNGKLYHLMQECAQEKQNTDLIFNTLFCGTRENPTQRASILNLSEQNFTPGDMVLSCINGITDELYNLYAGFGKNAERLIGSGNGVRKNPLLIKAAEERFNCKLQIPSFSEEASCGAAIFAYCAKNKKDVLNIAKRTVKYNDLQ